MDDLISRQAVIDTVHKTIYQYFDVCGDDEEVPMSDKDKLLLEINKAICNNLKALEQEPTETWSIKDVADTFERHGLITEQEQSGDLISRQAVLDVVEREQFKGDAISEIEKLPSINPQPCEDAVDRQWLMRKATERFYTTNYFNHITKMIEEAPSVKPQKSGEWMTNEIFADEYIYTVTFCSECEEQVDYRTDYCPYCGARMESE